MKRTIGPGLLVFAFLVGLAAWLPAFSIIPGQVGPPPAKLGLSGALGGGLTASTNYFCFAQGANLTGVNCNTVSPSVGVLYLVAFPVNASNLTVKLDANATAAFTVTVFKNGAATALACTVAVSTNTCSNTANSIPYVAGDTLTMRFAVGASTGFSYVQWSWVLAAQ